MQTMRIRLALAGFCLAALAMAIPAEESAKPGDNTVRPEVGKPITAARELVQAKKYKDALVKVHEAETVPNLSGYEKFAIDLTRGSAAQGAGDTDAAISSFESAVSSERLPAADQLRVIGAIAQLQYQAKNYGQVISWATRYEKEGGTEPGIRQVLTQAYYLGGQYGSAARLARDQIEADENAKRKPTEDQLLFLASCYLKMNDTTGYASALELLVAHHPKKSYWADLISRMQRKQGFADRLGLDVLRLQLATGNLNTPAQFMEMAQLALQAGFPLEAKRVLDQGYSSGLLGKGPEAERQNRLRELANKQAAQDAAALARGTEADEAKDGDVLVAVGYNYVLNGKVDRGLSLMEEALHKGALKHSEDAKLHLGLAYAQAGQKPKSIALLQSVKGNEGTADLARLWILHTNHLAAVS
jgi:hypothetical protein